MTNLEMLLRPASRWAVKNWSVLVKILIVTVVLIAGAFFAPRAALGNRNYLLLLGLYVGGIGMILLLRWPLLVLFITLFGALFIPFSGPSGVNVSELGIILLLGIWILDMLAIQRKFHLVRSRTMLPLWLFIIASILAFGVGQMNWFDTVNHAPIDAQIGGLVIFLLSCAAFLLVSNLIKDIYWLEWFTWVFITLGSIYVVGRAIGLPVDRFFQNGAIAGSMFWTWLLALVFGQALINNRLNRSLRAVLAILSIAIIYVAYALNFDWKSGWMPPLVSVGVIVILRYRRIAWLLALFVLIPALYFLSTEAIATDQYSWGTRLDAWLIVIELAKTSPILGLGFGNYHFYTILIPFRGWYSIFNSHSQYVDLFAQVGLVGLVCYLWFFGEITRLGWWLKERVPEGFAQAYVYSALGGIVGTLVAGFLVDWVLPFVYNIGMTGFRASMLAWIFMGGLVSLEQMVRKQSESPGLSEV